MSAASVFSSGGRLWWADDDLAQLGTVAKRDGRNMVVLRNKTSGVVHMKVYDRDGQKGEQALQQMNVSLTTFCHTLALNLLCLRPSTSETCHLNAPDWIN